MIAAHRTDLRAEFAAQLESEDTAHALAEARAAAYRQAPYWPFGTLTPSQQRDRAAQERVARAGRLARYPEGLL